MQRRAWDCGARERLPPPPSSGEVTRPVVDAELPDTPPLSPG
uniref:Uncharacterized protein n=1 Tax=Arundo donax TaxID=35708 RepID=A0A0A9AZG2_ARUDO